LTGGDTAVIRSKVAEERTRLQVFSWKAIRLDLAGRRVLLPRAASPTEEKLHNTTFTPEGAGLLLAKTRIKRPASPPDEVFACR
jgi:hypothetical protein